MSAARGSAGINQAYVPYSAPLPRVGVRCCPAPSRTASRLPAHQIDLADVDRVPAPIDGDDHRQRHRRLGGRHGDDKDGEDLTSQAVSQRLAWWMNADAKPPA